MRRLFFPAAVALAFGAGSALADERALNGAEIAALFSGKTITGIHHGRQTRQYFAQSGLTLWASDKDATVSEGRWEVQGDSYCSAWNGLWSQPEWGCLAIHADEAQGLYYFIGDDFRAPFVPGGAFVPAF